MKEYIKSWKDISSDIRERKRMEKATPSHSQHRHDLTRIPQTLSFMPCLFFVPYAGILHLLLRIYTVIKDLRITIRRIAASTT